jgi:hypothetical protein
MTFDAAFPAEQIDPQRKDSDMKPPALSRGPAGYASATTKHTCPLCAGYLIRIPRRATDRLLSLFALVHRYRCSHFSCQWEGRIRVCSRAAATMTVSPR